MCLKFSIKKKRNFTIQIVKIEIDNFEWKSFFLQKENQNRTKSFDLIIDDDLIENYPVMCGVCVKTLLLYNYG